MIGGGGVYMMRKETGEMVVTKSERPHFMTKEVFRILMTSKYYLVQL